MERLRAQGITAGNGLTVTTGGANITGTTGIAGTTNINTGASATGTNIGNAASTTTVLGATNINTSGATQTTIGASSSRTVIGGGLAVANAELTVNGQTSIVNDNATPSLSIGANATGIGLDVSDDVNIEELVDSNKNRLITDTIIYKESTSFNKKIFKNEKFIEKLNNFVCIYECL